jgi:hypothetical protein
MPAVGIGRVPATLADYGAVHDKSDDKVEFFDYESFTRNKALNNATLLCVGRVRSRSEGGTTGGAINRDHSKKTNGGDRSLYLSNSKQGIGPALFFGFDRSPDGAAASSRSRNPGSRLQQAPGTG